MSRKARCREKLATATRLAKYLPAAAIACTLADCALINSP